MFLSVPVHRQSSYWLSTCLLGTVPEGLFTYVFIIYMISTWSAFNKKEKVPSGSIKPSQETLTRTLQFAGYGKGGNLPGCCLHCPGWDRDSHNSGHLPLQSCFHSLSHCGTENSSPSWVSVAGFGAWLISWLWPSGAPAEAKGNIFVLSDDLKSSRLHVPEIRIMLMMVATYLYGLPTVCPAWFCLILPSALRDGDYSTPFLQKWKLRLSEARYAAHSHT